MNADEYYKLHWPDPVEAAAARVADKRAERMLRDWREWKRQPHDIAPEDAGRELEFAWGEAYDLGYKAALEAASAGEAGTATTTKIGLVHEHAVPKGDAHD